MSLLLLSIICWKFRIERPFSRSYWQSSTSIRIHWTFVHRHSETARSLLVLLWNCVQFKDKIEFGFLLLCNFLLSSKINTKILRASFTLNHHFANKFRAGSDYYWKAKLSYLNLQTFWVIRFIYKINIDLFHL